MSKKNKKTISVCLERDDVIRAKDRVEVCIFGDGREFEMMDRWEQLLVKVSNKLGIKSIELCKNLGELQDRLPEPLKVNAYLSRTLKKQGEPEEIPLKDDYVIPPEEEVIMSVSEDGKVYQAMNQWRYLLIWASVEFGIDLKECRTQKEVNGKLPEHLDIRVSIIK